MNWFRRLFSKNAAPSVHLDSKQIGGADDPIRQLLFADPPLDYYLQKPPPKDDEKGILADLARAAYLAQHGKRREAIALLKTYTTTKQDETRCELLLWSALGRMCDYPERNSALEVLGVVLEQNLDGIWHTLAAYGDGTARYLTETGASVFWEANEESISSLCNQLGTVAVASFGKSRPRPDTDFPRSKMPHLTFLTRQGNRMVENPRKEIITAGFQLMNVLIRRSKKVEG